MGVILDSSVVIAAQRRVGTAEALMERVVEIVGDQSLALSAIGYTELLHGVYRADTAARRAAARTFIEELTRDLPVLSYTKEIAERAGRIDAEQKAAGYTVPFADLLIGATALDHGFAMLTANLRHFALIPGLEVMPF